MLERLTNAIAVSGNEGAVRKMIRAEAEKVCGEIYTDALGNLYCHKAGKGPKVMVCAHMDEVGFIVTGITDSGLLRYSAVGIDARTVVSKRVSVGADGVLGVIGAKAIHLQTDEEFARALKHKELFIDVGAEDKAGAEKLVKIGDYAGFTTKYMEFGDGLVSAKALDDRVGCYNLLRLLANDYECDFYAVFTVQEETGLRGAQAAVFNVAPDFALVLEGTTANDMPEVDGHRQVTRVGRGPAISFMDGATIVKREVVDALRETAYELDIPWQYRCGTSGGTDAGAIHKALAGCPAGGISVGCRYIHSPMSVASKSDIENAYRLADGFLKAAKFMEVL